MLDIEPTCEPTLCDLTERLLQRLTVTHHFVQRRAAALDEGQRRPLRSALPMNGAEQALELLRVIHAAPGRCAPGRCTPRATCADAGLRTLLQLLWEDHESVAAACAHWIKRGGDETDLRHVGLRLESGERLRTALAAMLASSRGAKQRVRATLAAMRAVRDVCDNPHDPLHGPMCSRMAALTVRSGEGAPVLPRPPPVTLPPSSSSTGSSSSCCSAPEPCPHLGGQSAGLAVLAVGTKPEQQLLTCTSKGLCDYLPWQFGALPPRPPSARHRQQPKRWQHAQHAQRGPAASASGGGGWRRGSAGRPVTVSSRRGSASADDPQLICKPTRLETRRGGGGGGSYVAAGLTGYLKRGRPASTSSSSCLSPCGSGMGSGSAVAQRSALFDAPHLGPSDIILGGARKKC